MKELEWGSSSGPPPVVIEGFVKIASIEVDADDRVTFYYDHIDDVIWRADEAHGRCNWYISSGIR